jgi:hypothetical protein
MECFSPFSVRCWQQQPPPPFEQPDDAASSSPLIVDASSVLLAWGIQPSCRPPGSKLSRTTSFFPPFHMRGRCWPPAEAAANQRVASDPERCLSSRPGRPSSHELFRPQLDGLARLLWPVQLSGRRGRQSPPTSKGLAANRRSVGLHVYSLGTRVKLTERDNLAAVLSQ